MSNSLKPALDLMLSKGGEDAFVRNARNIFEDRCGLSLYDRNDPDVCRYCLIGAIDAVTESGEDQLTDQLVARIAAFEKKHIDDVSATRWLHDNGPKAALELLAMEDVL